MDTAPCKCRLKCFELVDEAHRQQLFYGLWQTTDFNLQNAYICGCVKVLSVKRRYTDSPADSHRNYSRVFYVQNGPVPVKVCKQAFLKIHAITNGRLNRALKAVEKNGGSPHQDQRGRHEPVNKTPTDKIELHIESFPATSSHYSRAENPNRKYLSSQLSLSKMYLLYKEMCSSKSQEPVTEWVYRKVFNEEFNLSFGRYVLSLSKRLIARLGREGVLMTSIGEGGFVNHKLSVCVCVCVCVRPWCLPYHGRMAHTYALIPLPLTHKHTCTCTHSSCLSCTNIHAHTLHASQSHAHTHTHSLSLSLPHTHFSPKSDTCKTCDEFKVQVDAKTDSEKHQQLMFQWELHKIRAQGSYQSLREDTALSKSSADVDMLTFDLQQVLMTPLLTTNVVFYKRQLSTYNLGIHDCKTDQGFMHMWHESVASRGSAEIGSCLLHHLQQKATTASKLILYSDSSGGQHRNVNLLSLWLYIVANPDLSITQIDQKFLVSGHSFLPNDRDFGSIASEKRRRSQIFSPSEWYQLVRECRRTNPFIVTEMKREDFVNVKDLKSYIVNRKINKRKGKVDWLSIRWIRVTKDKPFAFQYRYSLNELEAWNEIDLSRKRRGRPVDIGRVRIPELYDGPLKLKKEKMSDLMSLLAYIPPHYHDFYKQLQASSSPSVGDEDSGDENSDNDEESDCDGDGDDMDTD